LLPEEITAPRGGFSPKTGHAFIVLILFTAGGYRTILSSRGESVHYLRPKSFEIPSKLLLYQFHQSLARNFGHVHSAAGVNGHLVQLIHNFTYHIIMKGI